jgi:hypothetical protein
MNPRVGDGSVLAAEEEKEKQKAANEQKYLQKE